MKIRTLLFTLGGCALASLPLAASPITFNFGGANQVVTSPHTFSAGSLAVTAYGLINNGNTSNNLYLKNTGASEDGLGLAGTDDFEINPGQRIVFDVSHLESAGITGGTFTLGSLQSGELAQACYGTSFLDGLTCITGISGNSGSIGSIFVTWQNQPYVSFLTDPQQSNSSGNFLVETLQVNQPVTTPEPTTLVLFSTALLCLGWVTRQRWIRMR
ncbi:MAG: PEP-CTERM sorting domain-containing protein [Terriglobales bacterium]